MGKQIVELLRSPFRVRLADRPCSVFVSDRNAQILIDEGDGDDRMNGAVLYADQEPRFDIGPDGKNLRLSCGTFQIDLGSLEAVLQAEEWAIEANLLIRSKAMKELEVAEPKKKGARKMQAAAG
jgi:hypothetical protein